MTAGVLRYTDQAGAPPCAVRRGLMLEAADRELVRGHRARGLGWAACARIIGTTEHDLRLAMDPAYDPPAMLLRAGAPAPPKAAKVEAAPKRRVASNVRAAARRRPWRQVDDVLLAFETMRLSGDVAVALRLRTVVIGGRCRELVQAGLLTGAVRQGQGAFWSLTEAGKAEARAVRAARGEGA